MPQIPLSWYHDRDYYLRRYIDSEYATAATTDTTYTYTTTNTGTASYESLWFPVRDTTDRIHRNIITDNGIVLESIQHPVPNPPPHVDAARIAENQRLRRIRNLMAARRAKRLLISLLSPIQKEDFVRTKSFLVNGQTNIYRIHEGRANNIEVLEPGGISKRWCIHPLNAVPNYDTMAAQLLMIQTNEQEFIRKANKNGNW